MGTPKHLKKSSQNVLDSLTNGLDNPGDHKTFDTHNYTEKWNGGIMAVHVENIGHLIYFPLFSVTHYFKQNGDMCQDPEMLFFRKEGKYYPCMFQSYPGFYQESVYRDEKDGAMRFAPKMQRDDVSFANDWMENIKHQQNL